MIKAVLFDLDGTLADTLTDIADSANYALTSNGYPAQQTEDYKYFVGDGMTKLIERILPETDKNAETIEKIRGVWLAHYMEHCLDNTRPYDGMVEALAALKKRGIKLGVVTNKHHETAEKVIYGLFGRDIYECVYGFKDGVPRKPDPFLVFKSLAFIGAEPNECIYIGDSGVDIETAKNAGCISAGAAWGFRSEEELEEAGAGHILYSPAEIPGLCF